MNDHGLKPGDRMEINWPWPWWKRLWWWFVVGRKPTIYTVTEIKDKNTFRLK